MIVKMFKCEQCGKVEGSEWEGPPKGWVRLEGEAKWDATNYHIYPGDKKPHEFCTLKCFVKYTENNVHPEWPRR